MAVGVTTPASAKDIVYQPVSGAGSTWSANAVSAWAANVVQYGWKVNYSDSGSSDGRKQFSVGTVDFALSEIPYGRVDGTVTDQPPSRGYAYMPIVAGGTAIMYNLKLGNTQITNLRLSGDVLTKIFTGVITKWNDPAIAADNPNLALPAIQVVPVVRTDGSGTSAQFTAWMASEQPQLWQDFCNKVGRGSTCTATSNYPVYQGFVGANGSLGVSGYVSQPRAQGTITYVEYSYALNTGFPVVKVLNNAGYYTEPTAQNVAVGLLKASINTDESSPDYLVQQLSGVYRNKDARTYPLSSYSYMIVPTKVENNFTEDKGHTLSAFAYYFLCQGQQQADVLGYSPLPKNLVEAGLDQVRRIPGAQLKNLDISKCNNPTFSSNGTNLLAANAPQPPDCDKKGDTQCSDGTGGNQNPTQPTKPGGGNTGGTPSTPNKPGGSNSGGGNNSGGNPADPNAGGNPADPNAGGDPNQPGDGDPNAPQNPEETSGGAAPESTAGGQAPSTTGPKKGNSNKPGPKNTKGPKSSTTGTAPTGSAGGVQSTGGADVPIDDGQVDCEIDTDTGECVGDSSGGNSGGGVEQAQFVNAIPVSLDQTSGKGFTNALMVLAGALVLVLMLVPAMITRRLRSANSGPAGTVPAGSRPPVPPNDRV